MNTYERIIKILKKEGIAYNEVDQTSAKSRSIEDLVAVTNMTFAEGLATLVFVNEKNEYIVVLRRDDRNLISKNIKKITNSKSLNFATEEQIAKLGYEAGLASPVILGELQADHDLKILVDSKAMEMSRVICGIGKEGSALEIQREDLFKLIGDYQVSEISVPNENRQAGIKKRILTGDRPTGKLHIGHYIGTLKNRVLLQDEYEQFVMVANVQALTDNFKTPEMVRENIEELLCDYYAVGIDFDKTTVFIQSEVPQIHEIFVYLSNFVSIQQIQHNPTIKTELSQRGFEESTPLGFFMYPIHQAGDILCVNADLVPVGKDQAPMVEDCRELARKFNNTYKVNILHEAKALFGNEVNLPGTNGDSKMSKSLNNCIFLSDSEEELRKKIFSMKTDVNRIKATDKGTVEGNIVFTYHDLFNTNTQEVEDLKRRYREGTVGDVEVKEKLFIAMNNFLLPIRNRRKEAELIKSDLLKKAILGSEKVRNIAQGVVNQMKVAMKIDF
jgi:tryptophanyl-tRNA synthetase